MSLSPEQLKLIAQRLNQKKDPRSQITPQSREADYFPLSFPQQRLWFIDQMNPGNPAYNISMSFRYNARLDVSSMEQSFNSMLRRHDILRATFESRNGQPVQSIAPFLKTELPVIEISHLPPPERESRAFQLALEESRQPFDLAKGPLIRAKILKFDEDDYALLLSIHHIIFDGTCGYIFMKEFEAFYEAFCKGESLALAKPTIQYVDYAVWQRRWLQGETLDKLLLFWERRLAGAQVLDIPTDYSRPAIYSYRGATKSLTISKERVKALNAVSRRNGATLFMTMLAAFKILLCRYSRQKDITVGTPLANRNQVEIEEMIGLFVNTVVLRTDLSGDPTFAELLGRVRKMCLDAFAHQDMPLEELVKALNLERDLSHQPLFQVMFHFNNTAASFRYQDDKCEALPQGNLLLNPGTAQFDLTLSIEPVTATTLVEDNKLTCLIEYNTDLFEGSTIERMLGHYHVLLEAIIDDPQQRISELPLVTEAERHQLLIEFNNSETDKSVDKCIPQLFEEQVEATPAGVAVLFESQQITYSELNARANQLAHHLIRLGVGPETIVGVYLERSSELIVAILGILKTGGAYAPLDPVLPKERLAFMLEDLRVPVVLTRMALKDELLSVEPTAHILCLDSQWEVIARESAENPVHSIAPENLAYVIYTSGSTGRPKGVLIPAGAIAMHALYARQCYGLEPADRALQFFQINLDGSLEQIFSTLISGAGLVLRDAELWTPVEFQRKIEEFGITVLNPLPAYLRQVMRGLIGEREKIPVTQLKLVMIGGDGMLPEDIHLLRHSPVSTRRLMHCYGPTEATIYVTNIEIPAEIEGTVFARKVPIGRPVEGRKVYILDARFDPVPVGVSGEICIGEEGLARGYLDRPDLTAEKFIPDPFSRKSGARMYKTGDLARYLPDGNIEFIGRLDQQVKIRGYRIELGEIEAALMDHPSLLDALVVAREDVPGNKRLVAYVVTNENQAPTSSELRSFLKTRLPDYMVPSAFVTLDAFPMTPSGKIDRQSLPAPAHTQRGNAYVAPRTQIEKLLTEIWAQALGLDKVGIADNFFELGGDSILSIQIVANANQSGIGITQRQIFQYQTIAELAEVTGTIQGAEAEQGYVSGQAPLTPIQRRFFEANLTRPHHFNQAFLFESNQSLDPVLLEKAVRDLLAHHDALRLRFVREGSEWRQFNAPMEETIPLTLIDLSRLTGAEQNAALEARCAELQASLNLSEGPVIRVALFDLGSGKSCRLLIAIHHLAVDIVSWRIILEDLHEAYQQLSRGERVKLPAKTTSFKKWAELLVEHARSATIDQELGYWLDERIREAKRLPVDYSAGKNDEKSARTITVELDEEETRLLVREAPKAYRTQGSDILLTALGNAFANWTGDKRLLIDLEGHGREDQSIEGADVSRTVGWFTSLYPVVLEVGGGEGESLKQVKGQMRRVPGAGIGYGLLRYMSGRREAIEKMRALPQAEVSFNYLGQFDQVMSASSMFTLAGESSGPTVDGSERRPYLLEVTGWILSGRLQMGWTYSENMHRRSTIEALAQEFIKSLRSLINHCLSPEAGGFTPADFSEANLSQSELDDLVAKLSDSLD